MITLSGTLFVKTVHGRRGDFAVGTLITEIGQFKIKDTILDQFSEGEYCGQFAISRIYLGSYAANGVTISELRANITDIELEEATEKPVPSVENPSASDPIEEPRTAGTDSDQLSTSLAFADEAAANAQHARPQLSLGDAEDIESAIAEKRPVKLDPTVDRARFRTQRDRLKAAGYRFDAPLQTWLAATAIEPVDCQQ